AELIENIARFEILPSAALDTLTSAELTDVLRSVEGVWISGSKEEKIRSLIDFYEEIVTPASSDATDERARYYDALEELAVRDYRVLRGNGLISKDLEVGRYFESATTYLFEVKLGARTKQLDGSKRADGRIQYSPKEICLWDNKSSESLYRFPNVHYYQFLEYIESDPIRPTASLVVVGDVYEAAELIAH